MIHVGIGHLLLALVAVAGVGAPSSYLPGAVSGTSRPAPPASVQRVCGPEPSDAAGWTRLFGSLEGDWAGGDAALSQRLPDGRILWFFGDSFVGAVGPDGARAAGSRIVRNAALVTDGACAAAATPGTATLPGRGATWLWPTSMALAGTAPDGTATVVVFAQRMASTGTGAWSFRRTGAAVATLSIRPDGPVRVRGIRDLPRSEVLWGAGVVRVGSLAYIYGTRAVDEPLVFGRELLVARTRASSLRDPSTWTYRTADGWSRDASRATAVVAARDGVSTNPSVVMRGGTFLIVTKPQEFLDDRVVELSAGTPYGPWTSRVLFRSPSTETVPTYAPAVVDARRGDVVVVSRTSTSLRALMDDASTTYPVFRDVRLGR